MTMFAGALTALVTPFRGGVVDEAALRGLVEGQIAAGIHGLVPCGTTGESVNLSEVEYRIVVRAVVEEARGRVPVLAGAGGASTRHVIELAGIAEEVGADGLLSVVPYYNRPTEEGVLAHYRALTAAAGLPVVVYNIPSRTGSDLGLSGLRALANDPQIVGIKEATGTVQRTIDILAEFGDRFTVLSGDDVLTLPTMAVGAHGVVSVVSHLAPEWVAGLTDAMSQADLVQAREFHCKLLPLIRACFLESNPGPVKCGLAMLGGMTSELRLPLVGARTETRGAMRAALTQAGKL